MKANVYQIFYSSETRASLDAGFIPLDNTGGRPDWYEYWPIRQFLLNNPLNPNEGYGFLSPKFGAKSRLSSETVFRFLAETPDDVDVVTFPMFYDVGAFYLNVFEHACHAHPGIAPTLVGALKQIMPSLDINTLVMTSKEIVFCNYLVAKPAFWAEWIGLCDQLFAIAESGVGELAEGLNESVTYVKDAAPAKVFLIERMASLLLCTQPQWRVRNYNALTMPTSASPIRHLGAELLMLDGLKFAVRETGFSEYLAVFRQRQSELFQRTMAGTQ
ncbi:hypothetical protein [Paraburkholderia diazotrophica]|uniref:Uncharacterized protein n=1 Tax=Paraburkholderia diazotrophica TaxID=667676 RepID=A0A1H7CXS0_9BURK|nr:hypothetical protein [Paraburkholderia diazotrophica]SEJ94381.1 hypothetical protein SAMN05192539_102534 [Paraburkholderia diazotrophica]